MLIRWTEPGTTINAARVSKSMMRFDTLAVFLYDTRAALLATTYFRLSRKRMLKLLSPHLLFHTNCTDRSCFQDDAIRSGPVEMLERLK